MNEPVAYRPLLDILRTLDPAAADRLTAASPAGALLAALQSAAVARGPRVCVAAIVTDRKGRLALVRTRRGLELPGGKHQLGERWRAALARETAEELGVEVGWFDENPLVLDGMPVEGASYQSVVLLARGRVRGDAPPLCPAAGDSVTEARWFAREEVPLDELSPIASAAVVRGWVAAGLHDAPGVMESAEALLRCALGWRPEARLLGNIRACDIANVAQAAMVTGGLDSDGAMAARVGLVEGMLRDAQKALVEVGLTEVDPNHGGAS